MKLTLQDTKDLTYELSQAEELSDSITIKGNIDYPMLITDPMVLKKGAYTNEQLQDMLGQLKGLAKSYDVKIDLPIAFEKTS